MSNLNNNTMETSTMSFEKIYNENYSKVLGLVQYKLGNKDFELAEEITNDVFLKVSKHLDNYNKELSSFSTWLYNIAGNTVIDHWRKNSLDTTSIHAMKDDNGKEMFDPRDSNKNPLELMVNNEGGKLVEAAIDSLPSSYRRLSEMFFLEDCSHKEIQDELNIPINTIKVQIHRAKKLLKQFLS
jgi:RNA polymerase sigma-70 factor (ECF subfamily)